MRQFVSRRFLSCFSAVHVNPAQNPADPVLSHCLTENGMRSYDPRRAESGCNSMVECQLPKLKVASSSLVTRSNLFRRS